MACAAAAGTSTAASRHSLLPTRVRHSEHAVWGGRQFSSLGASLTPTPSNASSPLHVPPLQGPGAGPAPKSRYGRAAPVTSVYAAHECLVDVDSRKRALEGIEVPEVFGNVHSTESFSAVDGPGVRYLVFVQGCAMRCLFCSNPDTWAMKGGNLTSSKDLSKAFKKVMPYLKPRGGITISGGEAMLQPKFVAAVFQEVHKLGLTTCIDTTGQGTKHGNWDVILPHADYVLFCIKHMNPAKYEALTGLKMKGALRFAEELAERRIPYWIRYVYIPGYTDDPKDIDLLIEFAKQQPSFQGVELLPYHRLGVEKWKVMQIPYPLDGIVTPPKKQVLEVIKQLTDAGVSVLCAE